MKKEILISIYIGILSGLFFLVSFLLYLTKGKNSNFLDQKLKLGALIIAMTVTISCAPRHTPCYEPVVINDFLITSDYRVHIENSHNRLPIVEAEKKVISGCISDRYGYEFSYILYDWNAKIIQSGDLKSSDGKFDETIEGFEIKLKKKLITGAYSINFYTVSEKDRKVETKPYKILEIIVITSRR
ncbi:hypothetical protein KAU33_00660 [Candidatus Dependentiae bacterium]|nr:hypothetical protein [Candidatus Dependentiae bacterium]